MDTVGEAGDKLFTFTSTAGKVSPKSPSIKSLTSPLDRIASCSLETTYRIPTHSARVPDLILAESCVGEIVRAIL